MNFMLNGAFGQHWTYMCMSQCFQSMVVLTGYIRRVSCLSVFCEQPSSCALVCFFLTIVILTIFDVAVFSPFSKVKHQLSSV